MAKRNSDLVLLGRNIAAIRQRLGLKQDAVAHEANVATKTLSELERGLGNATYLTLLSIARAMNVPVRELLEFASNAEPMRSDRRASLPARLSPSEEALANRIAELIVQRHRRRRSDS